MKLPLFLFYDVLNHPNLEKKCVSAAMATGLTTERHMELNKIVPALKMNAFTFIVEHKIKYSDAKDYFEELNRLRAITVDLAFGDWWTAFVYSELNRNEAILFGGFQDEADAIYFRMAIA